MNLDVLYSVKVSTFFQPGHKDTRKYKWFPHFRLYIGRHHSRAENVETSKVRRQNDKQSGIKNGF